jgi:Ca2+-binding EF-hand superfamily protein
MAAIAAVNSVKRGQMGGRDLYPMTPMSDADRKRQDQAWKEYEHKVRMNKIIKQYDTNNTNKLEKEQLIELLTAIDGSTPAGTKPSEEEVDYVVRSADQAGDGCINAAELEAALGAWMTYVEHRQEWDEKMKKYDVNGTGTLSREEVNEYLKDLNGGKEVKKQELDMVMAAADLTNNDEISKMELSRATSVWYGYVERKKRSKLCVIS